MELNDRDLITYTNRRNTGYLVLTSHLYSILSYPLGKPEWEGYGYVILEASNGGSLRRHQLFMFKGDISVICSAKDQVLLNAENIRKHLEQKLGVAILVDREVKHA